MHPSLIVHGGAGDIARETHQAHVDGARRAAQQGWEMLHTGCSALDAVEAVIRILEDDPVFDAGRGSFMNTAGRVEMDALIMDGSNLESGAVAAVRCIQNPISLARLVMTQTEHALLVGPGALEFALKMGIECVPEESLVSEAEMRRWQARTTSGAAGQSAEPGHGTVGAVARDAHGNIAAATSTGGTPDKMPGRVGDSPLIGCGAYADNLTGGASGTGVGETLMKALLCKTVCDLMGSGLAAQLAVDEAIRRLADPRIQGIGGVIAVDHHGGVGFGYNTPHMARAVVQPDGSIVAAI